MEYCEKCKAIRERIAWKPLEEAARSTALTGEASIANSSGSSDYYTTRSGA
jgi:hypothetical protein